MTEIKIKPLTKCSFAYIVKNRKFKVYIYKDGKIINKKYLQINDDEEITKETIFKIISSTIKNNLFKLFITKKYITYTLAGKKFYSKLPSYINTFKQYSDFYKTFITITTNNFLILKYYKSSAQQLNNYLIKNNYEGSCSLIPLTLNK
jgi:hypothetical protein